MSKVKKDIILFWSWSDGEETYKNLVKTAPEDWVIHHFPYPNVVKKNINNVGDKALKFLEENNINNAYILGHSLGGALAMNFALKYPEKVSGLFLVDSTGINSSKNLFSAIKGFFTQTKDHSSEEIESIWLKIVRILTRPGIYFRLATYALTADFQKKLTSLKVPTQIFWGRDDKVMPMKSGETLHKLIKNSKFKAFENQGHDWILHSPELFWKNIDN